MEENIPADLIIQHHLQSFSENNITEVMKDYTEQSEVWTPEGKVTGIQSIQTLFNEIFKLFPAGNTKLELKQMITGGDTGYIAWNSDSPVAKIPVGTDTFKIKENKILLQTFAAYIVMK